MYMCEYLKQRKTLRIMQTQQACLLIQSVFHIFTFLHLE